jgi:hypothetical protein
MQRAIYLRINLSKISFQKNFPFILNLANTKLASKIKGNEGMSQM